jgi:multiple sugar transport system permease protein
MEQGQVNRPGLVPSETRMPRKLTLRFLTPYLFLLPGFIFLSVWLIYPMVKAFQMSLYNWSFLPNVENIFIGFKNYFKAFSDPNFWVALKNTLIFLAVTVPGQLILGLVVALLLEQVKRLRVFFRAAYYIPVITSLVVVTLLFRYLFNSSPAGMINYLLVDIFHLLPTPIAWLNEPGTALVVICLIGIFKGVGWTMVIFLAALQGISEDTYRAAAVDGANGWQIIRYITLPLILPALFIVLIMLSIGAFQAYIHVALLTNGGPVHRTEVLLSYMYYQAFTNRDFGYASAISYILIAIVAVISQFQLRLLAKEL